MKFNNIGVFSHQGTRAYQEDSLFADENILIVSDGVGGNVKGDLASKIVVESFEIYAKFINDSGYDHFSVAKGICDYVVMCLQNSVTENPALEGMAATLATVYILNNRVVATHIGDSRIYHFSEKGELKWRTKDHSFVQQLIDAEMITAEQASKHPKRNVITRVLQGKKSKQTEPETQVLSWSQPGDRLLICSDGVVEVWPDEELTELFTAGYTNEKIVKEIEERCMVFSKDNNTAIVASI